MKLNIFQLIGIGTAIATAVNIENDPNSEKSGRRERAVRAAAAGIGPSIPYYNADPENIEDTGVIIDAFVRIQSRTKAAEAAAKATKAAKAATPVSTETPKP